MLFHNKYSLLNINVLYFRISRRYNMGINDFIQIGSTIKELRKAKGISQKKCLNFWIFHILHTQIMKIITESQAPT